MKVKILIVVYILLVLVGGKILLNYFYNENVIRAYDEKDYSVNDDLLKTLNVIEPYIPYYNDGNILYRQGKYEEAIEEYEKAIEAGIPELSECPVRINMALAKVATLDKNYKEPEHIDESLEILYAARDMLLEDGCATEDGDGHSKRAERLKRDIEAAIKELEELKEQQQQQQQQQDQDQDQDQNQDQNQNQPQGGNEMQEKDQQAQQGVEDQQRQAYNDRQDDMDSYTSNKWNTDYEDIW